MVTAQTQARKWELVGERFLGFLHSTYYYGFNLLLWYWELEVAVVFAVVVVVSCLLTLRGGMAIKQREVYHGKYFRRGGSYAIVVPPDIRELMHFLPGDTILMNCDEGVLWMVRATKSMVIDRTKMSGIFDRLFADKRQTDGKNV